VHSCGLRVCASEQSKTEKKTTIEKVSTVRRV